ncbi:restriction endonuclease subunit S [Hydrogenophaga sp.]|uniref:restriction endonuclease subunit S n=1 Tax=Hydrogenophaga sp. TaxID=1904254 RepID=UPI003F6D3EAB
MSEEIVTLSPPNGWQIHAIGDIAEIATGSTPPTADSSNYGDEFLFVGPGDIDDSKWIVKSDKRLSKRGFLSARRFPPKSVLFVCIGSTIGKCAIASVELASNQQINAVLPAIDFDSEFLYYGLSMAGVRVKSQAGEQAVPIVNKTQFSETKIAFPPLPEQRAIATALSDVDALIAGLERLIAKKRDIKQATMQQLLTGQTRLPGFSGEWEVKRIAQFGEIVTGGTPSTETAQFWGEEFPWVTPTDISSNRDMFESERSLTRQGLSEIRALPENTVLVTCIASIGKNAILKSAGGCNQQINAVIPDVNSDAEFLYYLFESSKKYLLANAGTSATSIVSKAIFSELEFEVPSLGEQTAIAAVFSDIDADLEALAARLAKTRAIKQGMMRELLTGRIRLVEHA